jgi:hypothetical protein
MVVRNAPGIDPGPAVHGLIRIRHIRGMRSSWSGEGNQLNGRMEVTVVVRLIPGCPSDVARQWHDR